MWWCLLGSGNARGKLKDHARVKKKWKIVPSKLKKSGKLMAIGCWFPHKFLNSGTLKLPGFRPLFFGRDPSSRAKTNKNKNEPNRQSKVGGAAPLRSKSWSGKRPRCPPPPGSWAYGKHCYTECLPMRILLFALKSTFDASGKFIGLTYDWYHPLPSGNRCKL